MYKEMGGPYELFLVSRKSCRWLGTQSWLRLGLLVLTERGQMPDLGRQARDFPISRGKLWGGHACSLPLGLHGKVQNLKISSTSLALASMDLGSSIIMKVKSRNPHLPRAGSFGVGG